jgi:hypothetical protein
LLAGDEPTVAGDRALFMVFLGLAPSVAFTAAPVLSTAVAPANLAPGVLALGLAPEVLALGLAPEVLALGRSTGVMALGLAPGVVALGLAPGILVPDVAPGVSFRTLPADDFLGLIRTGDLAVEISTAAFNSSVRARVRLEGESSTWNSTNVKFS